MLSEVLETGYYLDLIFFGAGLPLTFEALLATRPPMPPEHQGRDLGPGNPVHLHLSLG